MKVAAAAHGSYVLVEREFFVEHNTEAFYFRDVSIGAPATDTVLRTPSVLRRLTNLIASDFDGFRARPLFVRNYCVKLLCEITKLRTCE